MEQQETSLDSGTTVATQSSYGMVKFGPESADVRYEVVAFYNFTDLVEGELSALKKQILTI